MIKKLDTQIYETYDYPLFKRLEGNRDIKCVKKIVDSIQKIGYVLNPILVNEKYEVIDGQNRICALEELGLPVHYYIVKGANIETARHLNLGRTNWKPIDYIKSYAEEGHESYQLLCKLLIENSGYGAYEMVGITKKFIITTGWPTKSIETGEFNMSIKEYNDAQEILSYLNELKDIVPNIKGSRRTIITALAWCLGLKECNKKRLIEVVLNKYPKIRPVVDSEYMLYDISQLYNNHLSKSKMIDFDVIYRQSRR